MEGGLEGGGIRSWEPALGRWIWQWRWGGQEAGCQEMGTPGSYLAQGRTSGSELTPLTPGQTWGARRSPLRARMGIVQPELSKLPDHSKRSHQNGSVRRGHRWPSRDRILRPSSSKVLSLPPPRMELRGYSLSSLWIHKTTFISRQKKKKKLKRSHFNKQPGMVTYVIIPAT